MNAQAAARKQLEIEVGESATADLPVLTTRPVYPLEALGPIIGAAAKAITECVQAPPELAAHSALAASAYVAQGKYDMKYRAGGSVPLSLFLISIADSGDRKTWSDKPASQPLHDWERIRLQSYLEEMKLFDDEQAAYEAEHAKITKDKGNSFEDKKALLGELDLPKRPLRPTAICDEPTLEGLQRSFADGLPSQAIFNDEGGQFFGGHAMNDKNRTKTISGLSKFWDGSVIKRVRAAAGESLVLYDRRLSVHLQCQPVIAAPIYADQIMQQQGILARFLTAETTSLRGTRMYNGMDVNQHTDVIKFQRRLASLLEEGLVTDEDGGLVRDQLTLTEQAQEIWIEFYNYVETLLLPGGALEAIPAVASKMAENVARIAGVMSVIEGDRQVGVEVIKRATTLGMYYLDGELRRYQVGNIQQTEADALEVLAALKDRFGGRATVDEMQKKLPPKYRQSVRQIRSIMRRLVDAGRVTVKAVNKRDDPSEWEVLSYVGNG